MKRLSPILVFLFSISLGLLSLTIVSLIPHSLIKNNFIRSAQTLMKQGQYPSIGFPFRKIVLDNFSDALLLNIAYSINEQQPFQSAIKAIWYAKTNNPYHQIENLSLYIQKGNNAMNPIPYERYWHGYLVFLRTLLILCSYGNIRIILILILFTLVFLCSCYLWKIKEKGSVIALIVGLLYIDFPFFTQSFHFSIPFIIGFSMLLYLLKKNPKVHTLPLLFLLCGIFTAFFDILTTPIITFGLLWFGVLSLYKNLKTIKHMFNMCCWSIGYAFMWVSKWIIAEITYMPGAFMNAINEVSIRTAHSPDKEFSRIETIKRNVLQLIGYDKSNKIFLLTLFIVILLLICLLLLVFKNDLFKKISLKRILLFTTLAMIPYIWYFIAANHAYMHVWFTYRDQLLTVIGGIMILFEIFLKKFSNHEYQRYKHYDLYKLIRRRLL